MLGEGCHPWLIRSAKLCSWVSWSRERFVLLVKVLNLLPSAEIPFPLSRGTL